MSLKVLFLIICLSIVLLCARSTSADNESDKAMADAWIRDQLYRKRPNCAHINRYQKKKDKPNPNPTWTVVILVEEIIGNKSLHRHLCTGSLIDLEVVLTSASCVNKMNASNLIVRAGESKEYKNGSQDKRVRSVIKHEQFSESKGSHDIALVFLTEPFSKTYAVNTVCLGSRKIDNKVDNLKCFITTWRPNNTPATTQGYRQFYSTPTSLIAGNVCQDVIQQTGGGSDFTIDSSLLCAVAGSNLYELMRSSGAPLVCIMCNNRVIQLGVLSYGFATSKLPFVLTDILQHRNWIDKTYGKLPLPYEC